MPFFSLHCPHLVLWDSSDQRTISGDTSNLTPPAVETFTAGKRKLCFTSLRGPRETPLEVRCWMCLACSCVLSPHNTPTVLIFVDKSRYSRGDTNFGWKETPRLSPPLLARRTQVRGDLKINATPCRKMGRSPANSPSTPLQALRVGAVMQNSTYPLMASQAALQPPRG